jgi:GGDEF domain-containing protein
MLVTEVVDELGSSEDFIGHAGSDNFIVITNNESASLIKHRIKDRFAAEILTHYNFIDRQNGYMQVLNLNGTAEKVPFMTLSVGIISPTEQSFADIREITELAAEARRQDSLAAA